MARILRYILFLSLIAPNLSYANIWGDIGACVTAPCSCGCKDVNETWNGITKSYTYNCNCPPYNKKDGRAGCLKQYDFPSGSDVNYIRTCAENPGGNTYFNPKVKVRMQACNVTACWTQSMNLKYDGQCTQWPGPYGVPLTRLCARIAVPGSSLASGQDDDGYTQGVHLNSEGATVKDRPVETIVYTTDPVTNIVTSSVVSASLDRPKLCVYKDPWALDYPLDLMDINPLYQPFHAGSGLSPIAQIMIAIAEMQMSIYDLIPGIFSKIGVPSSITNALLKMISFVGEDVVVATIKTFGQLNRKVTGHLGCIDIPMGPFPPPYCNPMKPVSTGLTIDPICHNVTADTGLCPKGVDPCILKASSTNICVMPAVASANNNAINNMVRIGFDNFIPLCLPNNVGITPSTCVNLNGVTTASVAHAANDILPKCGSAPCVNTTLPVAAGNAGFRVLYAIQNGSSVSSPNSYYDTTISDCPTSQGLKTGSCQSIWGINAGPFVDVAVTFPATESGSVANSTTLVNSGYISIVDLAGATRTFNAAITRVQNPTDANAVALGIIDQDPSNICVFETTKSPAVLNGCVLRATPPLPVVTQGPGDNFNPSLNVSLTVGSNSTSGSVTVSPVSTHNITNANMTKTLNLAGLQYTTFVTDSSYHVSPFDPRCTTSSIAPTNGGCSPNSGSLLGIYYSSGSAVSNNPTTWTYPFPQYVSGLEYVSSSTPDTNNNAYRIANIIGGNAQICLSGMSSNIGTCPQNPRNCVLANLDANGNVSTDPNQRVQPATNSITLSPSQFYNYSISNANSAALNDALAEQAQVNTDIVSCQYYLSTLGILPTPYTNIQECAVPCSSPSVIVEYFVSPNPNQVVTICNTAAAADTPSYCFWPTVSADSCQVSKLMTIGYLPPVASPPNTSYSPNAKASAIEANLLITPGSSDTCENFLGAINSNYPGINSCNSDQVTSCATMVETISSTTPATTVQIQQCPDNSYCYTQTAGDSPCTLGCTGALEQPISVSCNNFLVAASPSYSGILSCSNSVCPSISTLQINYPTAATCTATTPVCTLIETVKSGTLTAPVKRCTSSYTITDANDLVLASNIPVTLNCYDSPDDGCTINTTNVSRLSADNVVIANPVTSYAPIICPPAIVDNTPPADSSLCIPDPSQPNVFNSSVCGLRNKTDVEWGLCAPVPPVPNCPAIANQNNIQWPASPPNGSNTIVNAIGCVAGYSQALDPSGNPYPIQRYCFANPDAQMASLAPLWGPILDPNAACIVTPSCPPVVATASNNYTTVTGPNVDGSTTAGGSANISCKAGYTQSSATVKCVRSGNIAAFAPYSNCSPVNCNAINSPSSDYGATWAAGAPGQVAVQGTCTGTLLLPKGGKNPVRDCVASGSTSSFSAPYMSGDATKDVTLGTCVQIQCPAITTPGASDGGATWALSNATTAGTTYTGSCALGWDKSGGTNPTRSCQAIADLNGNLVGTWGTVTNPCIQRTCPALPGDNDDDVNAIWARTPPTAIKDAQGRITNIEGAGAEGSGWVLGSCKKNKVNDTYFCDGGQSSRRPAMQPRRRCIMDSSGNVRWGDPYQGAFSDAVGCCNSCNIKDSNKDSCNKDFQDRNANNIPYGSTSK